MTAHHTIELEGPVPSPVVVAKDVLLEKLEHNERELRRLGAERLELLAGLLEVAAASCDTLTREALVPSGPKGEIAYRSMRAEAATVLLTSEHSVEREMAHAYTLINQYWRVFDSYKWGEISLRHTQVIVDAGQVIGVDDSFKTTLRRGTYSEQVLELAREMTPNRLAPLARRLAEQQAEKSLDERHVEARTRRRVYVQEAADGMADLYAHLPAAEAYAIKNRLMQMGRQVAEVESAKEGRTREELEADIFTDLLINGNPEQHTGLEGVKAHLQVLAPGEVLLSTASIQSPDPSCTETPALPDHAELAGYGPIDSRSARQLASQSDAWQVATINTDNGEVICVDRYRPSEQMRRMLGVRDQHCRFPGCRVPLSRCDLDHTIDAARGGPTATNNLAHLCRGHHTLKHHSDWSVRQEPGGVLEWRSPSGRTHTERPPSQVRFQAAF